MRIVRNQVSSWLQGSRDATHRERTATCPPTPPGLDAKSVHSLPPHFDPASPERRLQVGDLKFAGHVYNGSAKIVSIGFSACVMERIGFLDTEILAIAPRVVRLYGFGVLTTHRIRMGISIGVRRSGWTGSGRSRDRAPGVLIHELHGARVPRSVPPQLDWSTRRNPIAGAGGPVRGSTRRRDDSEGGPKAPLRRRRTRKDGRHV